MKSYTDFSSIFRQFSGVDVGVAIDRHIIYGILAVFINVVFNIL
ncbi:hypothetical protein [uncultured Duncaniella sp.]|nr:hypothetical protein [uncultured Duncaniella sp.]